MSDTRAGDRAALFLLGAAVGAAAALLMAPASGVRTRRRLVRKGEEVADYLIDAGKELVEKCEDLYERSGELVGDATHELSGKYRALHEAVSRPHKARQSIAGRARTSPQPCKKRRPEPVIARARRLDNISGLAAVAAAQAGGFVLTIHSPASGDLKALVLVAEAHYCSPAGRVARRVLAKTSCRSPITPGSPFASSAVILSRGGMRSSRALRAGGSAAWLASSRARLKNRADVAAARP